MRSSAAMNVYVGIGHGRTPNGTYDPGAVSPDGTAEHDLNRQVCATIEAALGRCGIQCTVEHDAGASHDPDYRGSVIAVNAGHYDVAIEVHFDESKAPAGGFGIYLDDGSPAHRLADLIRNHWGERGLPQRPNYSDRRGLWFLRGTHCPSLIWECDPTGPHPADVLATMGEAVVNGVCDYAGVAYIRPGQPQPTPAPPPEEDGMPICSPDPKVPGGIWSCFPDGGIEALEGARFLGSAPGHPEWHPERLGRVVGFGPWPGDGTDGAGNGYVIVMQNADGLHPLHFPAAWAST